MCRHIRFLVLLAIFLLMGGCTILPETTTEVESTLSTPPTQTQIASPTSESRSTPPFANTETPSLIPGKEDHDCSTVKQLPTDSAEAQQILEESTQNFKAQYPAEYMGMAILHRIDRLGEWAVIQGSVSGEAKDVIAVHQTLQGYQIAERYIITAPLESFDEPEMLVPEYFLGKLPEGPQALFKCLDQTWLLAVGYPRESSGVYQLAYVGTDDFTTEGATEINTIQSDGSNLNVLLHEPMLIMGLVPSPDSERIAFWGCPGSLENDCLPGEDEDLDVWVANWDGSNLTNLT